ncbi:MAG: 4-hydroxy-tetrahydrodipicolinate reductase [Quinella sp. 1Q5]|nr:4-hydroxy-tetrahydrodipicolinate reductase [Quinella sp. 1Q5]
MIKVLVNGALGRMGRTVCNAVKADAELELVGAVDVVAGEVEGLTVETNLDAALKRLTPDVMVDFTRPAVVFDNVMTALANKVSPVVGTTGLSDDAKEKIRALAEANDTPAFIAPNFALGAVLMMLTAQTVAKYMPEVEIIELHHDRQIMGLFRELNEDGVTILMITHDAEIASNADRIVEIRDGLLNQEVKI